MKAKTFDEQFDKGEDITAFLDRSKARRPDLETKRGNVDFPVWMIQSLDREARWLGVTRLPPWRRYWFLEECSCACARTRTRTLSNRVDRIALAPLD
ncbi:MAG: hypothetical protein NTW86_18160 [Candidatus Sumerlaeota bacterium]|nr:hypothetical protein [Candidatus Sumerlaeota bacterium]